MIKKKHKSFIKKNMNKIMLVTIILGVILIGPSVLQTSYDDWGTGASFSIPEDVTMANGEYVDLEWGLDSEGIFGDYYTEYQIYMVTEGDTELIPQYSSPISFTDNAKTSIKFSKLLDGYSSGDIIQVQLDLITPSGAITSDYVIITIEGETTEPATITTTTTTTTTTTDPGLLGDLNDMDIIIIMAIGGGIIFALAIVATIGRKMR